jgi:hypothetical protein
LCIKLVIKISLYYDARSEKHKKELCHLSTAIMNRMKNNPEKANKTESGTKFSIWYPVRSGSDWKAWAFLPLTGRRPSASGFVPQIVSRTVWQYFERWSVLSRSTKYNHNVSHMSCIVLLQLQDTGLDIHSYVHLIESDRLMDEKSPRKDFYCFYVSLFLFCHSVSNSG